MRLRNGNHLSSNVPPGMVLGPSARKEKNPLVGIRSDTNLNPLLGMDVSQAVWVVFSRLFSVLVLGFAALRQPHPREVDQDSMGVPASQHFCLADCDPNPAPPPGCGAVPGRARATCFVIPAKPCLAPPSPLLRDYFCEHIHADAIPVLQVPAALPLQNADRCRPEPYGQVPYRKP